MKLFSLINTLIIVFSILLSCQAKPVEVIFVSDKQDTATGLTETKLYRLKKQTINSDFNYSKLSNIDRNKCDAHGKRNLMPVFEPVEGRYNYYQFIATSKGYAYNGGDGPILTEDFHDILIIKTNNENKVVDAYQYTLEWAEPPLEYDLFKSSVKGTMLKDGLSVDRLKLSRIGYWNEEDILHKEGGIVKLQ